MAGMPKWGATSSISSRADAALHGAASEMGGREGSRVGQSLSPEGVYGPVSLSLTELVVAALASQNLFRGSTSAR